MAPLLTATILLVFTGVLVKAQVPPLVPAQFIFGDSLVDPGNNNYISTIAKSNFAPNGIDFQGGRATGRFCNGRTVSDIFSEQLKAAYLPAYLAPSSQGAAILYGVNYASAAAGILDGTGANYPAPWISGLASTVDYLNMTEFVTKHIVLPSEHSTPPYEPFDSRRTVDVECSTISVDSDPGVTYAEWGGLEQLVLIAKWVFPPDLNDEIAIGRIPFNKQLEFFRDTQSQFQQLLTPRVAAQVFQKSLYYVTIGSNDYINNYLLSDSPTRPQFTPQEYEDYLISELTKQLSLLYTLGARKIAVFGVGPLGCIPSQLASNNVQDGVCIEYINGYVRGFNGATALLLNRLSAELPGSRFVLGNSYDLVFDKILHPASYGLVNVNTGCCGAGPYNGVLPCVTGIKPCFQRDAYLFWDPFHPTDAVNAQLGLAFFSGPTSAISPMNIQQLAAVP